MRSWIPGSGLKVTMTAQILFFSGLMASLSMLYSGSVHQGKTPLVTGFL
jgi:hypothetical protein